MVLTKPDTLVNQAMHEAQIQKFQKEEDVFMVLNRGGGEDDDKFTAAEWTNQEKQFFMDLSEKYPMYQVIFVNTVVTPGLLKNAKKCNSPGNCNGSGVTVRE